MLQVIKIWTQWRPGNEADSCWTQCTYDIVRQYWQNGTTCIDSQPPHVGTLSSTPSVWRHPQQWSPWEQSLDSLSATATAVGYDGQGSHGHRLECARKVHSHSKWGHLSTWCFGPKGVLDMSTVYWDQDLIDDIVKQHAKAFFRAFTSCFTANEDSWAKTLFANPCTM